MAEDTTRPVDAAQEPEPITDERRQAFTKRFDTLIEAYCEATDEFEREHPDWLLITALTLAMQAGDSLRAYMENPEEPGVGWENPWIELEFAVEWNWKDNCLILASFNEEDVSGAFDKANMDTTVNRLASMMQAHQEIYTLQTLTHSAAYIKDGDNLTTFLPVPELDALDKLPPDEQEKALADLYQPFEMFGCAQEGADPHRGLHFTGDANGKPFAVDFVVEFHPLVVDPEAQTTHYPIVTGLDFAPGNDPAAWPEEEKRAFWRELTRALGYLVREVVSRQPGTRKAKGKRKRARPSTADELPRYRTPDGNLPQVTAPEVWEAAQAFADAPSLSDLAGGYPLPKNLAQGPQEAGPAPARPKRGTHAPWRRYWQPTEGETALAHSRPGRSHQTLLRATALQYWGYPTPPNVPAEFSYLWNMLARVGGIPGTFLVYECVGRLLELPAGQERVTVPTMELARIIGLPTRTAAQSQEARRMIYGMLRALEHAEIIGDRGGRWIDPSTKKPYQDTTCHSPLLVVTGWREPKGAQQRLDGMPSDTLEVTFTYGDWLGRFRGDRRMLQDVGNVRALARIPAGRPSGELAKRLGLVLQQRWREQAVYVKVAQVGEGKDGEKHPTLRPSYYFTRKELCELIPGPTDLKTILDGNDPHRAIRYWNEAIKLLRTPPAGAKRHDGVPEAVGLIGYYHEMEPVPSWVNGKPVSGIGGWQDFWWSKQRLDIRPNREITEALAGINASARAIRARRKRKGKAGGE